MASLGSTEPAALRSPAFRCSGLAQTAMLLRRTTQYPGFKNNRQAPASRPARLAHSLGDAPKAESAVSGLQNIISPSGGNLPIVSCPPLASRGEIQPGTRLTGTEFRSYFKRFRSILFKKAFKFSICSSVIIFINVSHKKNAGANI